MGGARSLVGGWRARWHRLVAAVAAAAGFSLAGASPALPHRVRERIAAYDRASERLISYAQGAGAAFFLLVWLVTPSTFQPGGYIDATPYVLTLYLALVALRVATKFDGAGRPILLALSIVLDVAVLLALIVCLPLTLGSPPADALKHSAAAFLFVIVALRGLRFHPFWGVFAGGVAATGWLALALWASLSDPDLVTDRVEAYLNGPAIFAAAEVDRVGALLALSAVLALVVSRARALVRDATSGRAAQEELSKFFARNVADQITGAETALMPGTAVRRTATIVFFDLRGYSQFSAHMPARAALDLLAEFHGLAVPLIRRHGGSVDKFLGDGILVSFGATTESATDAKDALEALEAVFASGRAWADERRAASLEPLAIGGAAASGEIVFGVIGHADRLEITVIGDSVNVAAKLEKHTKREGVAGLATAATYARARVQGFARPLEARLTRSVEGLGEPVDLVVVGAA